MRRTALFQNVQRQVEIDPLGEAEVQLSAAFHRLENEPVFPVGEILHAGDAVGEGIGDGEVESFAAELGRGRRDFFVDQVVGGCFADDAGGDSVGRVVDLSAGRIGVSAWKCRRPEARRYWR